MTNDITYLHQLLHRGYCCAPALVAVGLRHKGSENPELLDAMKALCGGLDSGLLCGALSGAACMMTLLSPQTAAGGGLTDLTEWFAATYGERYGGINCRDILGDNQIARPMICPQIMEETYKQAKLILTYSGYVFEGDGE